MGRVRRWWFPTGFAIAVASAASSGGRRRRVCLLIALICCSPVLLPLTFLSLPLFCVAAFCLRLGRRRKPHADWDGAAFLKRCEEGETAAEPPEEEGVTEGELLQRYLEDQLELVVASALDCDQDGAGDQDVTFVVVN